MPLPPQAEKEPSWLIELYRYTESLGWQKQVGASGTSAAIRASPRKDCIVIPALKQKFSLRTTSDGSSSSDKGTVIRRHNCILLLSRTRTKAMVLQFRSLQECLDFSDCFVALNNRIEDEDDIEESANQEIAALAADRDAVAAYLIRMLHEPSFEALVRNVETSLQATPDGEGILHSWVGRDFGGTANF